MLLLILGCDVASKLLDYNFSVDEVAAEADDESSETEDDEPGTDCREEGQVTVVQEVNLRWWIFTMTLGSLYTQPFLKQCSNFCVKVVKVVLVTK